MHSTVYEPFYRPMTVIVDISKHVLLNNENGVL